MVKPLDSKLEPGAPEGEESLDYKKILGLTVLALGVVYGDLGTNTLFVFKTIFSGRNAIPPQPTNVLGVVSLIFWSLIIVVSIKYAVYVMNADNRGEGGVMALMSLIHPGDKKMSKARWLLVMIGLFGATVLYGDCMVTGAISVLSAVEGLEVATKSFQPFIVPIALVILFLLYFFQSKGTKVVGSAFGPIMIIWFLTIGILGVSGIVRRPEVLAAVNPAHGCRFFSENGWHGFVLLGIVFLSVTGAEAFFADKGHFGATPIRLGWFFLVLPALLCSYFGQGAFILENPQAVKNTFFMMAPSWALYPLIVLATGATAIASQAVITGAFSITRQAIQLGYLPRLKIEHTSRGEIGQVYVGAVNWMMMIATLGLVIGFQKSTNLANAYGVAVATTMIADTILAAVVVYERWKWPKWIAVALAVFFLIPDTAYFTANLVKITEGGWFPMLVGILIFTLSSTWRRGRDLLRDIFKEKRTPVEEFLEKFRQQPSQRVEGLAIYPTASTEGMPGALLSQLEHFKVVHEGVVLLTLITESVPRIPRKDMIEREDLGQGFSRVISRQGFMEHRDIAEIFDLLKSRELADIDLKKATFIMGQANIIPEGLKMSKTRSRLFALVMRNALPITEFIKIPCSRVIELGVLVEL
jgi:KUP system potassium uptake protein